jgi:hypothetical protein
VHNITVTELARLRREELVAEAARARRVRAGRATSTRGMPRAWGWRRGRLVPVPRAIERPRKHPAVSTRSAIS